MENENLNEEQLEAAVTEIPAEPEVVEETVAEETVAAEEETPVEEETVLVAEEVAVPTAKKSKGGAIALTAVLCLLLGVCLTIAVLAGTGVLFGGNNEMTDATGLPGQNVTDTTENATEGETTEPVDLKSYSADAETVKANADKVVATVGDVQMNNGELQTCYQMGVYNFISANQYYLSYMGIDFNKSLAEQAYDAANGISWQSFLLDQSLDTWHLYTVLNLLGKEAGYELDEEGKAYLTEMEEGINKSVTDGGYESAEALLEVMVAPGTTVEGYKNFMAVSDYAYRYYNHCAEELENAITPEFLEQYYTENEAALKENNISKEAGNLVDVRHILIRPEGGTTAEDGTVTYSDEEWETCRQKAQDILDQWKAGEATEESFGALAKAHTADGNGDVGGLYEGVPQGQMVEEFDSWIFDESRVYGDTDLVKTQFGYHVMYFVDSEAAWISQTTQYYVSNELREMVDAGYEKWPMNVDYEAICLGEPKVSE